MWAGVGGGEGPGVNMFIGYTFYCLLLLYMHICTTNFVCLCVLVANEYGLILTVKLFPFFFGGWGGGGNCFVTVFTISFFVKHSEFNAY